MAILSERPHSLMSSFRQGGALDASSFGEIPLQILRVKAKINRRIFSWIKLLPTNHNGRWISQEKREKVWCFIVFLPKKSSLYPCCSWRMTLPRFKKLFKKSIRRRYVEEILAILVILTTLTIRAFDPKLYVATVASSSGDSSSDVIKLCERSNPSPEVVKTDASVTPVSFSDLFKGPGLVHQNSTNEAICEFVYDGKNTYHFAHSMQQLYRCVSWWVGNPDKQPVLLISNFHEAMLRWWSPYNVQFLDIMLTDALGVRLGRYSKRSRQYVVHPEPIAIEKKFFRFHSPNTFDTVRDRLAAHYELDTQAGCHYAANNNDGRRPKVTILNRSPQSGRHVLNTGHIQQTIEQELGLQVTVVDSMDGKSFLEQAHIMLNADILLSSHGAQLTSIPYLPRCAHVVELFPIGFFHEFFRSLTTSAGYTHWHVYTGLDFDKESAMDRRKERFEAKGLPICLPESAIRNQIIPTLTKIVDEWKTCCDAEKAV